MAKKKQRIPHKYFPWIDARKKFKLSDAHIQMARELGLSPKNFGKYSNNKDQPWKLPLPEFIEALYQKRFKKQFPDQVMTLEQMAAEHVAKREARKVAIAAGLIDESAPDDPDMMDDESPAEADSKSADSESADSIGSNESGEPDLR